MAIKRRNKRANPYKFAALAMGFVAIVILPASLALGGQIAAGATMAAGISLMLGLVITIS